MVTAKVNSQTEIPVEERGIKIGLVDALVAQGYKKNVAFQRAGIAPYQYYRWLTDLQKKVASDQTASPSAPDGKDEH